MFRSKRSRSRRRAGVGISLRVMAGRAYHGSLYARRHNLSFALYLRGLARTDSPGDGAGSCAPDAPGPCDSPPRGTRSPPASRGSPRRRRHRSIASSARASPQLAAREPPAPSFGRLSNATRGKRHRSSSADSADPSQGSPHPSSPRLLPLDREPPFFDEVLSQLQAHHQFANLRAGQPELAFFGIAPDVEPPLEEDALPALQLMGRHLALARDRRALRPAAGAGPIQTCSGHSSVRELELVRWTGRFWRCRRLPRLRPHVRPPRSRPSSPTPCPKKPGPIYLRLFGSAGEGWLEPGRELNSRPIHYEESVQPPGPNRQVSGRRQGISVKA